MNDNDDDTPPLLEAWGEFARLCLDDANPRVITDHMMAFFGGASTVVGLLRAAHEEAGTDGVAAIFQDLEMETEAFAAAVLLGRSAGGRA